MQSHLVLSQDSELDSSEIKKWQHNDNITKTFSKAQILRKICRGMLNNDVKLVRKYAKMRSKDNLTPVRQGENLVHGRYLRRNLHGMEGILAPLTVHSIVAISPCVHVVQQAMTQYNWTWGEGTKTPKEALNIKHYTQLCNV